MPTALAVRWDQEEALADRRPLASVVRARVEAALARRIPGALTLQPKMVRPVVGTGIAAVDEAVGGGIPVGALTEVVGAECSGRTSLALAVVAQVMREGKVCAWVDVSDALSPESAAAAGVDLGRLLWVRCGVVREKRQREWEKHVSGAKAPGHSGPGNAGTEVPAYQNASSSAAPVGQFVLPQKYFVAPPPKKGLHGGGFGMHPRDEEKGMENAVSGLLQGVAIEPRCAEPQRRVRPEKHAAEAAAMSAEGSRPEQRWSGRKKHWDRMDQALRAMDLLLQAGGFGTVVLDLGSMAPEHVSRIPLATWFRYRAAAERTQACVVLLTQYPCAKSSAERVLRMEKGVIRTQGGRVMTGFERRVEVVRRRFEDTNVVPIRKPVQRAGVGVWESRPAWAVHSQVVKHG